MLNTESASCLCVMVRVPLSFFLFLSFIINKMVNRLHSFSAEAGFSWSPNKYLLAAGSTFEDSTLEIFKLDLDRDSSQYKTTIKTGYDNRKKY